MSDFLMTAAIFILAMDLLGLIRVLRGPAPTDRMMAAQLIGSGGVAVLLLLSAAMAMPPIIDVALMLAILAVFASVGFANWATAHHSSGDREETDEPRP
jgi:multicomponent Na+:H+ antiporter subunit F